MFLFFGSKNSSSLLPIRCIKSNSSYRRKGQSCVQRAALQGFLAAGRAASVTLPVQSVRNATAVVVMMTVPVSVWGVGAMGSLAACEMITYLPLSRRTVPLPVRALSFSILY